MRLLLVEDDEILAETLSKMLTQQGYVVNTAYDGEEGWDYAQSFSYDLMLLDVSLPKLDGINLCRRLRNEQINSPILLLTANDCSESKVVGLDAGADDYVVKPCTIPELLARIRALLRRQSDSSAPILTWGPLQLDPSACEVKWHEHLLTLSPKEYNLLELFLRHPKQVFTKGAILEHLWSFDDPPGEETVRAHIKGLRRKLKTVGADGAIDTVYGVGYCLKALPATVEADAPDSAPVADPIAPSPPPTPDKAAALQGAIAKLWTQFREPILARMAVLEQAIAALETGKLQEDLRFDAERQAHKLVGSLGMFGLPAGSELARQLELALMEPITTLESTTLRATLTALTEILPTDSPAAEPEPPPLLPVTPREIPTERSPHVLIIDPDTPYIEAVQTEAQQWPLDVDYVATGDAAIAAIQQWQNPQFTGHIPDMVVLELDFPKTQAVGLVILEHLRTLERPPITLVLTAQNTFHNRVSVARLGVTGFVVKPIAPVQLMGIITQHLQQQTASEATILAVDDDAILLDGLAAMLTPWRIDVQTLNDPRNFWETLQQVSPDLLILDVDMPYINGLELCQVVRNDPDWSQLPIVFLSASRDRTTLQQMYQFGADDYIGKPVTEPELVTRIFNRLERSRLLRDLTEKDPLTGVANRYRSEQDFQRFFRCAAQENQTIGFVTLSIQDLQQINRDHGHDVGDRILQRFGQLLKHACSPEDIVARWSGGEFIIGLYGISRPTGTQAVQDFIHLFSHEVFLLEGQLALPVSVAAGLALYPDDGTTLAQLYQATLNPKVTTAP
jgi:diguanylate cyclase (GGDEF)-like protein